MDWKPFFFSFLTLFKLERVKSAHTDVRRLYKMESLILLRDPGGLAATGSESTLG